jgi:hypothetical protein
MPRTLALLVDLTLLGWLDSGWDSSYAPADADQRHNLRPGG